MEEKERRFYFYQPKSLRPVVQLSAFSDFTIGEKYLIILILNRLGRLIGGTIEDNQGAIYWLNMTQLEENFQSIEDYRSYRLNNLLNL